MMLSVSPSCIVRSSLEDMLEALQRRDENEKSWDVPPALPLRAVSRSRPPSAKRRLQVSSDAEETDMRGLFKNMAVEDFKQEVHQGTSEEVQKKGLHGHHDSQHLHQLNTVVVTFQSYVRGEIARKKYSGLVRLKNQDIRENLGHSKTSPLVAEVEELRKRVSMIEATLELKEKENASLREQVEHYKARWSEFEAKMKSNEEALQKQIASLQMDLAAAQKSAGAQNNIGQAAEERERKEGFIAGSNGVKEEFKIEKVSFEEYASPPVAKFPGLKRMIKAWTKDYKVRVRDSNTNIHSVGGHSEVGDSHRHWSTWWGKKSKRH